MALCNSVKKSTQTIDAWRNLTNDSNIQDELTITHGSTGVSIIIRPVEYLGYKRRRGVYLPLEMSLNSRMSNNTINGISNISASFDTIDELASMKSMDFPPVGE